MGDLLGGQEGEWGCWPTLIRYEQGPHAWRFPHILGRYVAFPNPSVSPQIGISA